MSVFERKYREPLQAVEQWITRVGSARCSNTSRRATQTRNGGLSVGARRSGLLCACACAIGAPTASASTTPREPSAPTSTRSISAPRDAWPSPRTFRSTAAPTMRRSPSASGTGIVRQHTWSRKRSRGAGAGETWLDLDALLDLVPSAHGGGEPARDQDADPCAPHEELFPERRGNRVAAPIHRACQGDCGPMRCPCRDFVDRARVARRPSGARPPYRSGRSAPRCARARAVIQRGRAARLPALGLGPLDRALRAAVPDDLSQRPDGHDAQAAAHGATLLIAAVLRTTDESLRRRAARTEARAGRRRRSSRRAGASFPMRPMFWPDE